MKQTVISVNSKEVNKKIAFLNEKKPMEVNKTKYGGYKNPPSLFPVVSAINSTASLLHSGSTYYSRDVNSKYRKDKHIMANLNNSALTLSVIFNKGEVSESKNRDDVMITKMHNGVITCAYGTEKYFAAFRLYSDKQGEVPMFVQGGSKLKPVDQQISAKAFMDLFYGGNYIDTKFYVNLTEEICEAIQDSSCKAIRFTFKSNNITERKDEEYQGNLASCYQIDSVEVETLDTYFGIGRKIDNDHIVNCIEQVVELAVNKKSNVVTAIELKEKGEKLGKNAKKKLVAQVREAITNAAQVGLLEEFNKDPLTGDLEEVKEKLENYKIRLAQLQAASKGLAETTEQEKASSNADNIEEARQLSSEETASFLLDLIS